MRSSDARTSSVLEPDIHRLVEVFDRHGVEYLVVGGVAARAYGAVRPTGDADCLVRRTVDNFERLAAAMLELHARLRVEGLSDAEAAALPTRLDATSLGRMEISTWRTDAGDVDILVDIPDRHGRHRRYEELAGSAQRLDYAGISIRVAGIADIVASKEWADRPKDHEALPELYRLRERAREPQADQSPPAQGD
jgi:hypothetical protein